ncbi:MAG TPA: DNA polymerase III subunit delta [Phycisphaerae bacterium]|nr:DNA polymerase III subunit delta [Phycisphaerae bacterium]
MTSTEPTLHSVYAVFGNDSFLQRQAVERIVALALRDEPEALGPTRIDGDSAELADALDELQTLSLLGGRRVVIVDQADAFITRYRKQLEAYCGAPADSGCLILICRSLPRNTRLHKIIADSGEVIECTAPRGQAVTGWITHRSRETHGKSIDGMTAVQLRELIGSDLETLDNELGKLAIYVGARDRITAADVEALTGQHREEAVFRVTDAMSAGDAAGALRAWEHVWTTDQAAPMRAIGGLAFGIRRLLEAKEAVGAGQSVAAVARRSGINPAVLERRIGGVSVEQLQQQLIDLYDADLATKTGLGDVASAVESFIIKHTVPHGRPAGAPAGGRR